MPIVTLAVGGLLSMLGIFGYLFSESRSLTALIPFAFGSLLEVCGALAMRPELKKHAMHGASVLALLGIGGSAGGFLTLLQWVSGPDAAIPFAVVIKSAMFVVCTVFLLLCIRSFIQARAQREAAARR
jgi:hypothetical protein